MLTVPGHDAILLCKNGSVNFLTNYKQLSDSGPVKKAEEIIWCMAAEIGENLAVILVTVREVLLTFCMLDLNRAENTIALDKRGYRIKINK